MKRPQNVTLSAEEGEALIEGIETERWTADDRRMVVHVLRWHFWLLFALQEAKRSLKRFRMMLFGEPATSRKAPAAEPSPGSGVDDPDGGHEPAAAKEERPAAESRAEETSQEDAGGGPAVRGGHRPGQGRHGAAAYEGAERVACRHEELRVGERCPVCGQGRLYAVPPGVEIRLDGNALLSAMRYELEKLRCSACGKVFTAKLPDGVSEEQ